MTTIKLDIDGQEVEAKPGSMIIQVADLAGIYIPRFCYHQKLSIAANCRMCLVEVENAPKPMPACATPIADGMVVKTSSSIAVEAQKGTMEFLLINHPLDCPVCDQGGECPLQDQALGYGGSASRFSEQKRAVRNADIGPLIATEMTRCIHCTRCVRFGQEVAGIMEFGAVGRGEDMKITTFMENTIDSEVSGNVIDLCPVGALTSKPYRFSARSWEMIDHKLVSPHDCLGSNLNVQVVGKEVKRVLPNLNEQVNECWLSDRDRFSYEAVNSSDRLTQPLVKKNGRMEEVGWEEALEISANNLRDIVASYGGNALGALCTPTATLEEFYLLQKLMRALGSQNIDHRLREQDFRDDKNAPMFPGSEIPVVDIPMLSGALLIGCNIRKELPLVALRFRQMVKNGGQIAALDSLRYNFNFDVACEWTTKPDRIVSALAGVARELAKASNVELPVNIERYIGSYEDADRSRQVASILSQGEGEKLVVIGQVATQHENAANLRIIASWMAARCAVRMAILPDANSAAGWIAGCVPHRSDGSQPVESPGWNAFDMVTNDLAGCLLYGFEPGLDYAWPERLGKMLSSAKFVLHFSCFRSAVTDHANVVLPLVPFTENSGTFVNLDGLTQFSETAVAPRGAARPGWKILRVLGNLLDLNGFDYVTVEDVFREIKLPDSTISHQFSDPFALLPLLQEDFIGEGSNRTFQRVFDVPLYAVDPLVRRATSLQQTRDNIASAAYIHPGHLKKLGIKAGQIVNIRGTNGAVRLAVQPDDRLLEGCAYIPTACMETIPLGSSQTVHLDIER